MLRRVLDASVASAFPKKLLVTLALVLALSTAVGGLAHLLSLDEGERFGGDFISFWLAAQRARGDELGAIYDAAAWARAISAHSATTITWFVYPPFSLFGLKLLGGMTYTQAVAWWSLLPIPFYFALLIALARRSAALLGRVPSGRGDDLRWQGLAPLTALTLPFLTANLLCGQTGAILGIFLLAAGYFWRDRPLIAGVFIGLVAIKPQLGLVIPFALAASGQWRTIAAATATVAALILASFAWAGANLWTDYLHLLQVFSRFHGLGHGQVSQLAIGPYVSLTGAGLQIAAAAVAQGLISLAVLAGVVASFRRREAEPGGSPDTRLDLRLGMLAAGALLATPYALSYDTPLLALAVVPLFVRAWRGERAFWELAALSALAFTPTLQQVVGAHVPFGLCALLLTFVALARGFVLEAPARAAPHGGPELGLARPQTA